MLKCVKLEHISLDLYVKVWYNKVSKGKRTLNKIAPYG